MRPNLSQLTVADLRPGDHLCCLYETEEEHRAVLLPFLRLGLERGERVIYIVDAHRAETVLGYLRAEAVVVESHLASGKLRLLTRDDTYLRQGVFDPEGMIALVRAETERALAEGYSALRVTGEMTWALRGLPGSERLIEYEAKLNDFFPGSKCLAICQYDRRWFDPAVLLDVLHTHPIAVIGTEIYDNHYYVPPAAFSENLPAARLQQWIKSLAARRRVEGELRRVDRGLRVLSECNQTLLRATDESTLLREICRIAVQAGGYRLAWVGFAEQDEGKTVRPVAQAGYEEGYLETLHITWADTERGRGPTGTAIRTGKAVIARNIPTDPDFAPWRAEATRRGYASSLALPLTTGEGQILGALNVYAAEPDAFDADEGKLLRELADDLAFGIGSLRTRAERNQAEAALVERTRQLEAVRTVTEEITRELDLPIVLGLIIRRAVELVGADAGSVWLWEEGAQVLTPAAWHGLGDWIREVRFRPGEGVAGSVAQRQEGMIVNEFSTSPYAHPVVLAHVKLTAVLAQPLRYRDRLVGVIAIGTRESGRRFTEPDRTLLTLFAAPAAVAIENARLFQQAQAHVAKLQAFYQATKLLTSERFPDTLLQQAVEAAARVIGARYGAIGLLNDAGTLQAFIHTGMAPEEVARIGQLPEGQGLLGALLTEGRPLRLDDLTQDPRAHGFPPHHPPMRRFLGVAIGAKGNLLGRLYLTEKDGGPFTAEDEALCSSFAEIIAGLIEKARLYQELRQAALHLEAKVEDRTRDLQAANLQLQETSRRKSEFLANMSHELRTPLNSIIGFAEILQGEAYGPLTEKQARYLSHIWNGGKHLVQLIADILDLSKVEAGRFVLQPESLPVQTTLEDILVIARGLAHQKAQEIQTDIDPALPPLRADPVRFKQILFNLLSNAVKFTPEEGRITLVARRASGDEHCLELAVRDTGVGITAEDLPRLFREFVQLETTQQKRQEGTGLGLALTKRLVELHGGRIWADSDGEGKGSTFTLLLPFGGPPAAHRSSPGGDLSRG